MGLLLSAILGGQLILAMREDFSRMLGRPGGEGTSAKYEKENGNLNQYACHI